MTQSAVEIDEAAAGRGGTVRVVIQPLGVAHVVAAARNGGRAGVGSDNSGGLDEGGARVGAEVWLLAVLDRAGEPMPWNTVRAGPGWVLRSDPSATVSTAIVAADRTELMLDAVQDAQLVFLRHSWSGPVQVEVEDSPAPRMQVFDLHHDGYERLVVNLDEIGRERGRAMAELWRAAGRLTPALMALRRLIRWPSRTVCFLRGARPAVRRLLRCAALAGWRIERDADAF